jgi:ActD protein
MNTAAVLAEFETPEQMLEALRGLRALGYRKLDAFTPYPVPETSEILELRRSPIAIATLVAGLLGASGAYFLEWWMNAYDYPIDVGGRPPHSAPAFVPITFEMGVLFAGLTAFFLVFILSRLPRLWHPVFDVEGFERASIDRFWIALDLDDPKVDRARTDDEIRAHHPVRVVWMGEAEVRP